MTSNSYSLPRSLCDAANDSLITPNAGGFSNVSEAYSIDYFHRLFGARNFIFEMQVQYNYFGCSLVDFICDIQNVPVSVSVTRAMRLNGDFSVQRGRDLLNKKIMGLVRANTYLTNSNSLGILHIWCQDQAIADTLNNVLDSLDCSIDLDIVIVLSVCSSSCIYSNN